MKKTTVVHGLLNIPVRMEVEAECNGEAFKIVESKMNNTSIAEMYINMLMMDDQTAEIKCDGWDIEWWLKV